MIYINCIGQTWSGTDERAILSPLLDAAGSVPRVVVSAYLPEIRADELDPERHFLAGEGLPLGLRRGNRRPMKVLYTSTEGRVAYTVCRNMLRKNGQARELRVRD